MTSSFAFDIPPGALPDFESQPMHVSYEVQNPTQTANIWRPEPYECKPDLESEKRKENGRKAAKKYRERVKEDKMLLEENMQRLVYDNTRLTEENATLHKILDKYMEKIMNGINDIGAFIQIGSNQRLHQQQHQHTPYCTTISVPSVSSVPMTPGMEYGSAVCGQLPHQPHNGDLQHDFITYPGYGDYLGSNTNSCDYDYHIPDAADTLSGSANTMHTTSDSHSTYNVFVFFLILLLPVKLFPYLAAGYISAKNAAKGTQILNTVSQRASFYAHSMARQSMENKEYTIHPLFADYMIRHDLTTDTTDDSSQSALAPLVDVQTQTPKELMVRTDDVTKLWQTASLSLKTQGMDVDTSRYSNINTDRICEYYNSESTEARSNVVELIEMELRRTCSAMDLDVPDSTIESESL